MMNKLGPFTDLSGKEIMSDVVLVLGMHRSGTSAIAGTLTKLGGAAPAHLLPVSFDNPRGFFESLPFMHFHDELLAAGGSSWDDWRLFNPGFYRSPGAADYKQRAKDLFVTEFNGSPLAILKDPRMCRFVPFWLDVLREMRATPHIVMPIRSPLDAAQSLKKRDGMSLTKGMLLWLRHVLDAEAQSRGEARSIFAWNEFNSDWRKVCDKISADTGLSWPRLSDRASFEIDNFLAKELVHHETDHAELIVHSDVHEWTLRAYEALLELARNPLSNSALDTLDQVRALLDQSSKMFGRILVEYEIGLEDLRAHTDAVTSERDLLSVRQSEILAGQAAGTAELGARAERAERALGEAVHDKEGLLQSLAVSIAERDALREEGARIAAELLLRRQELVEKVAATAEFAARAEHSERALDAAELAAAEFAARAERAQRALEEASRDKESLSQALAAFLAERDALHEERAQIVAELQLRQRELAEQVAAGAELVARAEQAERALGEAVHDKDGLLQSVAVSIAERDALREEGAGIAAELLSRRQELVEKAAATAEFAARAEHSERALDAAELAAAEFAARAERAQRALEEASRDKESLSQALAAFLAERDALHEERAQIVAELQLRQRELAEQVATGAELVARAERAERALDEVVRDRDALSQNLSSSVGELNALHLAYADALKIKAVDEKALAFTREEKDKIGEELSDTKATLTQVQQKFVEIESVLERTRTERQELAAVLAQKTGEIEELVSGFADRTSAERATHARAFAEAKKAHEAQVRALRGQLVDAEAALSHSSVKQLHAGIWANLLPAKFQRRQLARRLIRSGLFDSSWYMAQYPDVGQSGLSAAEHYLEFGFCRGYRPNPLFDTRSYLERYEDVLLSGMNPLLHYLLHGFREGRDPGPDFDALFYLERNPDVRANGMNPLAHYLRYGRHEGRLPVRPV